MTVVILAIFAPLFISLAVAGLWTDSTKAEDLAQMGIPARYRA